jgi:serine/threonine protein kinase
MNLNNQVIGEGTYGCIHSPSLLCDNKKKISYKNKVSKIMKKKDARIEIKETNLMNKIDPLNEFFLGEPHNCNPKKKDTSTNNAINLCKNFKPENINDYELLIMNNGGVDLTKFNIEIEKLPLEKREQAMNNFWIETLRIMNGLTVFLKHNIIHHDLKGQNMVYDIEKNRINFIDFGLMTKKTKLINECKKSKNWHGNSYHWSFPPEIIFTNKTNYVSLSKFPNEKKIHYFKEYFCKNLENQNNHLSLFFSTIVKNFEIERENSVLVNKFLNNYLDFLFKVNLNKTKSIPNNYEYFLEKSLDTIDSYGVAIGFIELLNATHQYISANLSGELYNLFLKMVDFDVFTRIHPNDAYTEYQQILINNNLLQIKNHNLPKFISLPEEGIKINTNISNREILEEYPRPSFSVKPKTNSKKISKPAKKNSKQTICKKLTEDFCIKTQGCMYVKGKKLQYCKTKKNKKI